MEDNDELFAALRQVAHSLARQALDLQPIIALTSELPLSRLDYWERSIRWKFQWALQEFAPQRDKRKALSQSSPRPWLELCSGDGYLREKALHSLSEPAPNAFFFALALRRLNDWVPQVRAAARKNLLSIAAQSRPKEVAEALSSILIHWHHWGHIQAEDKEIVVHILSLQAVAEVLKERILLSSAGPMPTLFSQSGRSKALDGDLEEFARKAVQPTVRAIAYGALWEGKRSWIEAYQWQWLNKYSGRGRLSAVLSERPLPPSQLSEQQLLKYAAGDASPIVRRIAGDRLVARRQHLNDMELQLVQRLASDPISSVAERGRFILKNSEHTE